MERLISLCGLFVMMGIAWVFSNNRKILDKRSIIGGLSLQFALAFLILKTSWGAQLFDSAKDMVNAIIALSDQGAIFLFGKSFEDHFFAFKVLPTVVFVSSLSYLLFYFGIMQKIVEVMAWVMTRVMGASGAESLASAANVFLGQTEAPMFIKPYIKTMTKSELTCMMVGGMANVAGGVLAAYVFMGISAGHLLAASIMSAPASILIAKIIYPETEKPVTFNVTKISVKSEDSNAFEAACKGASDGMILALNIAAMLIAFISLVALVNLVLGQVSQWIGYPMTFEKIMGIIFQPIAFIMGVPWHDSFSIGQLLGEKMVLNEFIAYDHLGKMMKAGELSERSYVIATYALCGFANFSSVAIQIGGIGALEPERRKDLAAVGMRALIGGTLSTNMTACIAGLIL